MSRREHDDLPQGPCAKAHAPKASQRAQASIPKASPQAQAGAPSEPAPKASPQAQAGAPTEPAPKASPDAHPLSRRTLLTAAAAVTAAACGPSAPTPPTAAFLGPDPAQAHRLRDGGWPQGPVSRDIRTQIAIVGGGVAGLAAAWRLRLAGHDDFQLLELEPELGGTARGGQLPRSPHPLGAHYLPSPHPECQALERLLAELGIIVGRDAQGRAEYLPSAIVAAPTERHQVGLLWREGLYPDDGETPEEAEQWARWRAHLRALDRRRGADGRRLFRLPVAHSSDELRHLDALSFATYLDKLGLTSERLRWAIDYACRDDYGCTTAQTSAFAGLHHFLARGLEDSREGHTLTWPEGNARLVRGLAERAELGDRLSLATAVTAIDPDAGHLEICRLTTRERARIHADAILWAAPRFVLPRVLPPGRDPLPHGALGYAPWLVASVELRTRPRGVGAPLAWDNVPIAGRGLGYVLATHTEDRGLHGAGAVVTYYEPMPGADAAELAAQRSRLLAGDLEHWQGHVRDALTAMHPDIARELVRIHITRWGHAMIRPVPGLLFGPALTQARAAIGRVQPCAADVAGLPLFEEAFYGGVLAAEAALRQLGRDEPSIVEA